MPPSWLLQDDFAKALSGAGSHHVGSRGDVLRSEGEKTPSVILLTSGFVVAQKRTAEGQQQNVAFYAPGDIVDHESYTFGASRCGALALTPLTYTKVPHARLTDLMAAEACHARVFWRYVALKGALSQEWLLNLGRRSAYVRTAHLLCELIYRMTADMTLEPRTCMLPMTQGELADTLGISLVHTNRVLSRFREERLIEIQRGQVEVLNWAQFTQIAGFDPSYLRCSS